ncbi:MAG: UvrD-helicase domain-containing protein, partial [Bacteroidota bacterium]|nr:UvrD-helicase domain-containing protein [Bacteroidota bacterium]
MIKVLKASAGSGKTFRLAKQYILLLLTSDSPEAYRHILAVTFTNKATAEMKQRILKELDILAREPERSGYHDDLVPQHFPNDRAL